jgi:hypothetical protein
VEAFSNVRPKPKVLDDNDFFLSGQYSQRNGCNNI